VADYVHGHDGLGNTGAASPAGSPCGVSAAQFIVDAVNAAPGEVTLLALASLTNVALALHLDSSVAQKLKAIVWLGGAFFCMGNVNPATEANVWHDPEAADWVLGALPDGVLSWVGLDVTTGCVLSGAQLDGLRDGGGRFGRYSWAISQFYKAYHVQNQGVDGIFLHDPTAFLAVLRPELFHWTLGAVRVATEGCARGKTLMDTGAKKWVCDNSWAGRPRCSVALTARSDDIVLAVLELLGRQ
jgi:uridine nucleosidase